MAYCFWVNARSVIYCLAALAAGVLILYLVPWPRTLVGLVTMLFVVLACSVLGVAASVATTSEEERRRRSRPWTVTVAVLAAITCLLATLAFLQFLVLQTLPVSQPDGLEGVLHASLSGPIQFTVGVAVFYRLLAAHRADSVLPSRGSEGARK